jgi:RimJ/RimL family protein N-acetyltransferase
MKSRPLSEDDRPVLEALLKRAPWHNVFHLSALAEFGLHSPTVVGGDPWAMGVFERGSLVAALVVLRGTGGVCNISRDREVLEILTEAIDNAVVHGRLALLSGHATQLDPLLPMVEPAIHGRLDRCDFCTLRPENLVLPAPGPQLGLREPRLATGDDMERLIDFYQHGFYSLARLPSRAAWRNRLSEQLAFRTLYLIENDQGIVISAAQSSAEGGSAAMLGGVATLDEYRARGLSTLCVGALCRHLFDMGTKTISLFYLKDNHSAARVYDKLGFRPAGEWLLVPMGLGFLFGNLGS